MRKKNVVRLTTEEREALLKMISTGKSASGRLLMKARILLKSDDRQGEHWTDEQISRALHVSTATIERTRALFARGGLSAAMGYRGPKRIYKRKLDEETTALLKILYYTDPPDGRPEWSMSLLAETLVEYGYTHRLSRETIRKVLREAGL